MGENRPEPRPVRGLAWAATFVLLAATGCGFSIGGGPAVQGSGVKKTEKRSVASFTAVEISGAMQLELAVGKESGVEITTDDNLLPLVTTEVADGTLRIHPTGNTSTQIGMVARVTAPELNAFEASGATTATVTGLKGKTLRVQVSGASRATLLGATEVLELTCNGASHVDAMKLQARSVRLDVSGASTVELGAARSMSGSVSGASTVRYQGSPENKTDVSGASSVKRK